MDKKNKTIITIKQYRIHLTTLIGIVLVLAGTFLASFPYLQNMYYQAMQERQIEAQLQEMKNKQSDGSENAEGKPSHSALKRRPVTSEEKEDPAFLENEVQEEKYAYELEEGAEGILEIPVLNIQLPIEYGVELSELQSGPGFYPESSNPDSGNLSIAGHRTTYGAPFRELNHLNQGDEIILHYEGETYTYKVEDVFDTNRYDWSVIENTREPAITLTTCHPPGSDEKRLIVRAYLEEQQ